MISVCLASYNGEKFIKEQINSILFQLQPDDELIISDDGSTDSTIQIVNEINDDRIKLLKNVNNHGVNSNFENAIKNSRGDYIFISDQDDVWLENKVRTCLKYLKNADLVIHDCCVVDNSLGVIYPSYFKSYHSRRGYLKNIIKNSYIGACMAFRREVLEYVLPFNKYFPVFYDGWIASLADLCGNVYFIDTQCMLYRRHGNNLSCSAQQSNINFFRKIYNRVLWLIFTLYRTINYKISKLCPFSKTKPS